MSRSYDNYYSQGAYEELRDRGFDYDSDFKGRRSYDYCRYDTRGYDYGDASGPQYRREKGDYERQSDYNYYQQSRPYRGAESPYSYDLNQARDLTRPTASATQPKALAKAAGKA